MMIDPSTCPPLMASETAFARQQPFLQVVLDHARSIELQAPGGIANAHSDARSTVAVPLPLSTQPTSFAMNGPSTETTNTHSSQRC